MAREPLLRSSERLEGRCITFAWPRSPLVAHLSQFSGAFPRAYVLQGTDPKLLPAILLVLPHLPFGPCNLARRQEIKCPQDDTDRCSTAASYAGGFLLLGRQFKNESSCCSGKLNREATGSPLVHSKTTSAVVDEALLTFQKDYLKPPNDTKMLGPPRTVFVLGSVPVDYDCRERPKEPRKIHVSLQPAGTFVAQHDKLHRTATNHHRMISGIEIHSNFMCWRESFEVRLHEVCTA